jgi:NDP-sugar pyrophosphorylase family protein
MVLAAGHGTRLGAVTATTPKCMVRLGGRPLLERVLEWLADARVTDLAVNLHHLPEVVTSHFGDGSAFGVRIRYSQEPDLLGTAGALQPLAGWLRDGRFLLVYGDNLIGCELDDVVARHEQGGATLTMALFHRDDPSASGAAAVDEDGRIHGFTEKPRPGEEPSKWVNAGLLVCEPRVLDFVPATPPSDFAADVIPALIAAGEPVFGYRMGPHESLHWIDTPEDLAAVDALFHDRQPVR